MIITSFYSWKKCVSMHPFTKKALLLRDAGSDGLSRMEASVTDLSVGISVRFRHQGITGMRASA
jgi:hypothetical protein